LESDESIGLVHAAAHVLYEDYHNKIAPLPRKTIARNKRLQGYVFNELIKNNFIMALTVTFRRSVLEEKIDYHYFIDNNFQTIDYALWLGLSLHSKICYSEDVVGVYCVRKTSISNQSSIVAKRKFLQTAQKAVEYYLTAYSITDVSAGEIRNTINEMLLSNSLFMGDYSSSECYAKMINRKSIKLWIKQLVSMTKVSVYLYSLVTQMFFRIKLSFTNICRDEHIAF
jgi:hypothetical protein